MLKLLVGSDIVVRLVSLRDVESGAPVTDATVTAKLYDRSGTEVTSLNLAHVGSGTYSGILPGTTNLVEGGRYRLVVTALHTGGQHTMATWCVAGYDE